MLPPAPGRLSMTTGCPSLATSLGCIVRAMRSAPPPGAYGTMKRSGFVAKLCALAACTANMHSTVAIITPNVRCAFIFFSNSVRRLYAGRFDHLRPFGDLRDYRFLELV